MIKNLIIVLIFTFMTIQSIGQEVAIMTYNIRLDVASDGENAWPERKDYLISQLQFHEPDIFGLQEALPHQKEEIATKLKGYEVFGAGRDGGTNGESTALFYKKDAYSTNQENTFWLSTTPDEPSKGWDAAYPRICTYALFTHNEKNTKFWVFNTHLDHKGELAKTNGINLVLEKITALNTEGYPVILMGDFNSTPETALVQKLQSVYKDSKLVSLENPFGSEGTFNGFKFENLVTRRIDYIFLSNTEAVKVKKYAVLTDSKDLKYPSDHFPVLTLLEFD